jgi:hypothetical protein
MLAPLREKPELPDRDVKALGAIVFASPEPDALRANLFTVRALEESAKEALGSDANSGAVQVVFRFAFVSHIHSVSKYAHIVKRLSVGVSRYVPRAKRATFVPANRVSWARLPKLFK